MSTKNERLPARRKRPGSGKSERYLQPSLLMGLRAGPSYGYELIQSIQHFGFVQGQAPPGMIYRHLRQLEEDGMVSSEWEMGQSGPAKRVYRLTADGRQALDLWIRYMEQQVSILQQFIAMYRDVGGNGSR